MNTISLAPTIIVDLIGSSISIIFTFLALCYAYLLIKRQPNNFLWGFLFYFTMAMTFFAISRGIGHILRHFLELSGQGHYWHALSPYSGGFNTLLLISAATVTIYYHRSLAAYKALRKETEKLGVANARLAESAQALQDMNNALEEMVEERTRDLSESEKKFRHFFENSRDMVYFCDANGEISDINPSGMKMLGLREAPAEFNLFSFFKNQNDIEYYNEALRTRGFISDFEVEMAYPDGTTRYMLFSSNALKDDTGQMRGCEGVAKDMTRLRTMTEQLLSQEKMASVGQMAAGVAHEINTPLGIILGYAQLMKDDFSKGEEAYENLEVIERQVKACRKIVADLLKFSRQSESRRVELDISEVIEDVLAISEHNLNINHIQVKRDFSPHLPRIIGDAEKLRQVIVNLINNAKYAMEKGGEIRISTRYEQEKGEVVARIEDTGSGIDEEIKSKVFDPFFTTKPVGKGTGLGLSVTYGIIQDHGGTITLESPISRGDSNTKQQGTAFEIHLPVAREAAIIS